MTLSKMAQQIRRIPPDCLTDVNGVVWQTQGRYLKNILVCC